MKNDRKSLLARQFRWAAAALALTALLALSAPLLARASLSLDQVVDRFEEHYSGVRTLRADFTQTSYAWGRTREESGTVTMARGGRMRWVYEKPEKKIFITNGKQIFFYVPAEKQLTISSTHGAEDVQVPLSILLQHVRLNKVFSRVEFASQALNTPRGDYVIRGYPRFLYKKEYRSILIDLTPTFDIRRLVVFYPDNSTMQFAFSHVERNQPVDDALFAFSPPPGTDVIRQ